MKRGEEKKEIERGRDRNRERKVNKWGEEEREIVKEEREIGRRRVGNTARKREKYGEKEREIR